MGVTGPRFGLLTAAFLLPLAAVAGRVGVIQAGYSSVAAAGWDALTPRDEPVPAADGRVLTADGVPWAWDEARFEARVHYRHLQTPPDPDWLRGVVRSRLAKADPGNPAAEAAAEAAVLAERDAARVRLAAACGIGVGELKRRFAAVQRRVERMKAKVAAARDAAEATRRAERAAATGGSLLDRVAAELSTPPDRGGRRDDTLAEELAYHRVAGGLDLRVAAAVEGSPDRFPGVRVVPVTSRRVRERVSGPHLLGLRIAGSSSHAKPQAVGRGGVEAAFDGALSHRPGTRRVWEDRRGNAVREALIAPPALGADVTLTIRHDLQSAVARRLAAALESRPDRPVPVGAAAVLMDVRTGAVLAAASAPTFDPADLSDPGAFARLRSDPRSPLLDRVTAMALPPGSVFKPVVVAAALEEMAVYGDGTMECRGFLDSPRRHRCACFIAQGVGHGPTGPADALCRSCNVWCFAAADQAGTDAVRDWAGRFGFGDRTGVGLPGERSGSTLPADATRDLLLESAVGQGRVTATPLQVCRMACAVANGGRLVVPSVVREGDSHAKPRAVGVSGRTLGILRSGMDRAVNDPPGTAYRHARSSQVRIAGKTGTAQVGGGEPSHAWFVGYAPADDPRVAVCVALEHGGSGGTDAGPVARDLLETWVRGGSHAKPQAGVEPGRVRRVR